MALPKKFNGYRRENGRVGIRNHVVILPLDDLSNAACEAVGQDVMQQIRHKSLLIYEKGRDYAAERGIIIADTKFEFGQNDAGEITLIDEVMTPDSSRFWPAAE